MMHALNTLALYVGWAALVVYFGTLLLAVIAIPFRLHAQRKRIERIAASFHAATAALEETLRKDILGTVESFPVEPTDQEVVDRVIRETGGTP